MMNRKITTLALAMFSSTVFAATIVPVPAKLVPRAGTFTLRHDTPIVADANASETGEYLATLMRRSTGYSLPLSRSAKPASIFLTTAGTQPELGAEGYELRVTPDGIVIRAATSAGLFYGAQTLLQLLPPQIFSAKPASGVAWTIPCVEIEDKPRFAWRGLMLDISRHYFNKNEVKQLLDAMALHKINTFHWHLVDDQGWRIEIKKYPKLTELGAWRKDIGFGLDPKSSHAYGADGRYGGCYTQADIREVIAYAASRHITIVPEIEMPGHSVAALSAYPELACISTNAARNNANIGAGVHHGVYCAGNDAAYAFVEDVLSEVIELFPSRYIHIGGDEVPKDNWKKCPRCQARIKAEGLKNEHELQSYFIRRVEKFVNAKGRTLIGWSEIREGGLAPRAALMDWIGGAVEGASGGHDVVMSPTSHCYFDYCQSLDRASEPKSIGGYLPLSKVYSLEPIPAKLAPEFHKHILGAQGNVWTEYIPSLRQVEYMTFPRLCALAEATWSPAEKRNFDDFTARLKTHFQRLDTLGVAHRDLDTSLPIGDWKPAQFKQHTTITPEWDITKKLTAPGAWRVALNYTSGKHGVDIAWVALLADGKEITRDTHAGFAGGRPRDTLYTINVPPLQPAARYTIKAQLTGNGGADSHGVVTMTPPKK